jgi:hypothetical protein
MDKARNYCIFEKDRGQQTGDLLCSKVTVKLSQRHIVQCSSLALRPLSEYDLRSSTKGLLLLFWLVLMLQCSSVISSSDKLEIVSVDRKPLEPPPDYSVEVVARISPVDALGNATLTVTVNNTLTSRLLMTPVGKRNSTGIFRGTIPPRKVGTNVTYCVEAFDELGGVHSSMVYSYTVKNDITEPALPQGIMSNDSPIAPWEQVHLVVNASDSGTGVKNVTLRYEACTTPVNIARCKIDMHRMRLTNGDNFNGLWELLLPSPGESFPNMTLLNLVVITCDLAGNCAHNERALEIGVKHTRYLDVTITITNINSKTITADFEIRVNLFLVPYGEPSKQIWVWMSQSWFDGTHYLLAPIGGFPLEFKEKYRYEGVYYLKDFWLMGDRRAFPFDSYWMNFTFEVYEPGYNETNARVSDVSYSNGTLRQVFVDPSTRNRVFYSDDSQSYVSIYFTIDRTSESVLPLELLLLLPFLLLGATLGLGRRRINERLAVYLAIFVLVAGLLLSLPSMVPFRLGFSAAEILAMLVVALTVLASVYSVLLSIFPALSSTGEIRCDAICIAISVLIGWDLFRNSMILIQPEVFVRLFGVLFAFLSIGVIVKSLVHAAEYRARRRWLRQIGEPYSRHLRREILTWVSFFLIVAVCMGGIYGLSISQNILVTFAIGLGSILSMFLLAWLPRLAKS